MESTIQAHALQKLLQSDTPPLLLHVLPEEHFAQCHLPGAQNACIYEMAFADRVGELVPDTSTPLVVYGEGGPSLDSEVAAARLRASGYSNVTDFRGGLDEWTNEGFGTEGSGAHQEPKKLSGTFRVDIEKSVVRWTGRNLFNHHEGTLRLASGFLSITNHILTKADFTLDMRSIACSDLTDNAWNAMLLKHLSTDDFFATDTYPTANFITDRAEAISNSTPGTPNYKINGHFTLRGVTKPLSFPAVIAMEDTDHLTGQAELDLDRTQFGSVYGSGKFFAALGKHVVNDNVHLHLKIYASR